jgi:hypothetical protein
MEKVYSCDGECLGDEYVNLQGVGLESKKAILHIAYTDMIIDKMLDQQERQAAIISAIEG